MTCMYGICLRDSFSLSRVLVSRAESLIYKGSAPMMKILVVEVNLIAICIMTAER